jgi:glycosyltransferase involved in cell wall biosynthesis
VGEADIRKLSEKALNELLYQINWLCSLTQVFVSALTASRKPVCYDFAMRPCIMKPCTIALDCRTALSPKTGDRTYTLTLLRGLAQLNLDATQWKFQLLLDAPDAEGVLPLSPCFEEVILTAPNSRLWTLWALPQWAKQGKPDLIHLHYLAPPFLPCPFVTTIHDIVFRARPRTFPPLHRTIMNVGMPATARRAAKIITVSEFSKDEIVRYLRVPASRIAVTYNAVDERYLKPISADQIQGARQKYHIGDAPYVLSVGVQHPRKNVARLIAAFEQLKTKHPDWPHQLVIAGKIGWGDNSKLKNQDSKLFIGYVADEDLPALYAGAACFAYPSLYEGFGVPIVEAMSCGAPVLTSDRGAMKEVAGGAAQEVNPYEMSSIQSGLEAVLSDANYAAQLRQRGHKRAAEFTVERLAEQTLRVYEQVLNLNSA